MWGLQGRKQQACSVYDMKDMYMAVVGGSASGSSVHDMRSPEAVHGSVVSITGQLLKQMSSKLLAYVMQLGQLAGRTTMLMLILICCSLSRTIKPQSSNILQEPHILGKQYHVLLLVLLLSRCCWYELCSRCGLGQLSGCSTVLVLVLLLLTCQGHCTTSPC
jgi:hypothetical protein